MVGSCNVVVVDEDVFCFQIWWRQEGLMLPVRWACSSTLGRDFVNAEEGICFAMADSSVSWNFRRRRTWGVFLGSLGIGHSGLARRIELGIEYSGTLIFVLKAPADRNNAVTWPFCVVVRSYQIPKHAILKKVAKAYLLSMHATLAKQRHRMKIKR